MADDYQEQYENLLMVHRSLLTELWDGVRAHGLTAPSHGRDGERLIHAYCGGIASLRNQIEAMTALAPSRDTLFGVLTQEIGEEWTPLESLDAAVAYLHQAGWGPAANRLQILRDRIKDALHEGAETCSMCGGFHGREVVHPCE